MIRIACTNCKMVLSIDDAFAGGVCRCQHCGTIQTVPARAKDSAGVAGQPVGSSKALFQHGSRSDNPGSGTGLDELAGIVASSGLAGSGLTSRRLTRPNTTAQKRRTNLLFITAAAVIVLLLAAVLWLSLHHTEAAPNTPTNSQTSLPTPPAGPNFCGVPIDAATVIFVLDRGSSTKEVFPALEDATIKSIASLGPDRRFQILFWSNGNEDAGYPLASTTYATKDNIEAARRAVDAVPVFGSTDILPALQKAFANNPDLLIITTAKGALLSDDWVNQVMIARGSSAAKIDTISLGPGGPSDALKAVAARTGGQYQFITEPQLRALTSP